MRKAFFILLASIPFVSFCQNNQNKKRDSNDVQFVTSDIARFWKAYDSCKVTPENSIAIYDQMYFEQGSQGLKAFKRVSIKNTQNFVSAITKFKLYYESIRLNTFKLKGIEPIVRKDLIKFKQLYPVAEFPNIYFLIGDLNSGGKSEKEGLLIGTEIYSVDSSSNFTNVYPPFVKVLKSNSIQKLPSIIIHELVHYEQSYADSNTNLLGYIIKEGSADFICHLVTGGSTNEVVFAYGDKHERELWNEIKNDLNGLDINKWLYNKATNDRPKDLGYYVGFKITESYYNNSSDKRKAIDEILNIKDFNSFLKKSRYGNKFN
jgi:hypothetical protein